MRSGVDEGDCRRVERGLGTQKGGGGGEGLDGTSDGTQEKTFPRTLRIGGKTRLRAAGVKKPTPPTSLPFIPGYHCSSVAMKRSRIGIAFGSCAATANFQPNLFRRKGIVAVEGEEEGENEGRKKRKGGSRGGARAVGDVSGHATRKKSGWMTNAAVRPTECFHAESACAHKGPPPRSPPRETTGDRGHPHIESERTEGEDGVHIREVLGGLRVRKVRGRRAESQPLLDVPGLRGPRRALGSAESSGRYFKPRTGLSTLVEARLLRQSKCAAARDPATLDVCDPLAAATPRTHPSQRRPPTTQRTTAR